MGIMTDNEQETGTVIAVAIPGDRNGKILIY
jgi:hypothetical protein